jgi:hypothetical protein
VWERGEAKKNERPARGVGRTDDLWKLSGHACGRNATSASGIGIERAAWTKVRAPDNIPLGIFIQPVMTDLHPPANGTKIAAPSLAPTLAPTLAPGVAPTMGPTVSERERVVDLLQLRFADDRLTLDDFEQRVALAYRAKTAAELETLVADLTPTTIAGTVPEHGRVAAIFSSNERSGAMSVPRELEIVATFGNVELDLSDATFGEGLTEIHVSALLGNVAVTLPLGMHVECSGESLFGTFDCKAAAIAGYPADADRVVRITGHSKFASVEIGAQPSRSMRLAHDSPRRLS